MALANSETLFQVIDQIYEAATGPAELDKLAFVLARVFNTESGCLAFNKMQEPDVRGMPVILAVPSATGNIDDWARRAYAEYYHDRDVWVRAAINRGMPAVLLSQELVDVRTLTRSEWYDFCKSQDVFHALATQFPIIGGIIGHFGAHRPRRSEAFDNTDRRKMQLLLPHLQRALQLHLRLNLANRERALALEALACLGVGVIVASAEGRVLFANKVAERVLQHRQILTVSKGKLMARDPAQRANLERLMFGAAQTSGGKGIEAGGLVVLGRSVGRTTSVLVSPLRAPAAGFGPEAPAAILVFSEPGATDAAAPRTAAHALGKAYGLTPAEARLTAALAAGERLIPYAQRNGVSLSTIRTQLRQVFAKTGCSRQADLVRFLYQDTALKFVFSQSQ